MEKIQTFSGGMNKDLNKSISGKEIYLDARNMTLTTDAGTSMGSIENIKGNKALITIPDTTPVYKISVVGTTAGSTITINGEVSATPIAGVTSATTGQYIYDYLITEAASYTGLGSIYKVAIGSNYVIVYSQTINPVTTTSTATTLSVTTTVAAQTNLDLLGWGKIREDLVLFTTNDTSAGGGVGQIWKLTYDKSTVKTTLLSPTITLIYNNDIDFTKQHPIPRDGATIGRYENNTIQRIYWTDNFNPLRRLNIADINAMALDPSALEVSTPATFSTPILFKINDSGGALRTGMYQTAYKLKNGSGATTIFSECSNWTVLTDVDSSTRFVDQTFPYSASLTDKSITWDYNNLDTDFDFIEIAILKKYSEDGIPDINIVSEEPIPPSGSFSFTYTGNEDHIPVDLNEFISYTSVFTRCKAIAQKDNILFAANLINNAFTLNFDCRAYRFSSFLAAAGSEKRAVLTGAGAVTLDASVGPPAWTSVTATADAIQTYTVQCDIHPTTGATQSLNTTYRFQTDGVTLGGEGPNIKYKFITTSAIQGDAIPSSFGSNLAVAPYGFNSRQVWNNGTDTVLNRITYESNAFYDSFRSPYKHNLLKGYYREEMYRFAIVFYDRQGRPGPANWIADIKFPRIFEKDNNNADTTTFVVTDLSGPSSTQLCKSLGIEFTVNWTNMSAADRVKIGGFSIVRSKREASDKRILGTGIVFPIIRDSSDAKDYHSRPYPPYAGAVGRPFENVSNAYGGGTNPNWAISRPKITFDCPDFVYGQGGYPGLASGSDYIHIAAKTNASAIASGGVFGPGQHAVRFYKMYTMSNTGNYYQVHLINEGTQLSKGQDGGNIAGDFRNGVKFTDTTAYPSLAQTLANGTLFMILNTNMDYDTAGLTEGTFDKYYAYYYRNLTSQYGGNTYSTRSNTEYINTGHFERIATIAYFTDTTTPTQPVVITVFGGDCFIPVIEHQKGYGNYDNNPAGTKESVVYYTPVETKYSYEMRQNPNVNRNGIDATGSGLIDRGENQDVANVLSVENDVRKFYPVSATEAVNTEFDNRVTFSQIKINGEFTDSWGIFKTNDFYDVEDKGPINNILVIKDQMYFWQPSGFGILSINPLSVIQDTTGAELQLGTGTTIQKHDYITTEGGSKHQWGIVRSQDAVYWFDAIKKKMWKYSGEGLMPLSDVKGMHGWFNETITGGVLIKDNPVYIDPAFNTESGICGTYDFENNKLFMTFLDSKLTQPGDTWASNKFTLTYNEQFDCFESFHDFYPTMYINDGHIIATRNPTSSSTFKNLFIHNLGNYSTYYGTVYNSTLDVILNDNPSYTKVFDNLELHTEVVNTSVTPNINIDTLTWDQVRMYTDWQNSDWITLTNNSNIKRRERTWKLGVPRNRVLYTSSASPDIFSDLSVGDKAYGERIRDKYAILGLKFSNSSNRYFIMHWLKYLYRASIR